MPEGAKLLGKSYNLFRTFGNEYLIEIKFWRAGNANLQTYDVLGEARFGADANRGEIHLGKEIEAKAREMRAFVKSFDRIAGLQSEEMPSGRLFCKPIPAIAAGQVLEAIHFNFVRDEMWNDMQKEKMGIPAKCLADYKPRPEEISRN